MILICPFGRDTLPRAVTDIPFRPAFLTLAHSDPAVLSGRFSKINKQQRITMINGDSLCKKEKKKVSVTSTFSGNRVTDHQYD